MPREYGITFSQTYEYYVEGGMWDINLRILCERIIINCLSYNLVRTAAMLAEVLNGFLHVVQANSGIISQNTPSP
jgi:hypothetical protein